MGTSYYCNDGIFDGYRVVIDDDTICCSSTVTTNKRMEVDLESLHRRVSELEEKLKVYSGFSSGMIVGILLGAVISTGIIAVLL